VGNYRHGKRFKLAGTWDRVSNLVATSTPFFVEEYAEELK